MKIVNWVLEGSIGIFKISYLLLAVALILFAVTKARNKSKGLKRGILSTFLMAATFLFNLESRVFGNFPGLNLQVTAIKEN